MSQPRFGNWARADRDLLGYSWGWVLGLFDVLVVILVIERKRVIIIRSNGTVLPLFDGFGVRAVTVGVFVGGFGVQGLGFKGLLGLRVVVLICGLL